MAAATLPLMVIDPTTIESRLGCAAIDVVNELIYMLIGMTVVTFLSLAYRHFELELARQSLPID